MPTPTPAARDAATEPGPEADPPPPPGLRWSDDASPGYGRRRRGDRFVYVDEDGEPIRDAATIARIHALAIPPAYERVWICADPRGHLQATGIDARGRKQYRYHPRWRELRDADKYGRMAAFGAALPGLRARIERDLAAPGMGRDKVLATVLRLMDATLIRVGNPEYARENGSYGLTTLRGRHARVRGSTVRLRFRGKSGIEHDVAVDDARVARVVRRCIELPGQALFTYVDDAGEVRAIDSGDVNDYLREATATEFTAKDFRTWGGSARALESLRRATFASDTQARRIVVATIRETAALLGNTPAVCRRCYVHPAIVDAFLAGSLAALRPTRVARGLRPEEAALIAFLRAADGAVRAVRAVRAAGGAAAGQRPRGTASSQRRTDGRDHCRAA